MAFWEQFGMCHTPCAWLPYDCGVLEWFVKTPIGLIALALLAIVFVWLNQKWSIRERLSR